MALQRNPIAGNGSNSWVANSLANNYFNLATSSKAQVQDGLNWWAGETGGTQNIIYSNKNSQPIAYPSGSGDYTPVAWGSFNDLTNSKMLELINGLPARPSGQFTSISDAMQWLWDEGVYFPMNQDYPFVRLENPVVVWDPSVTACSYLGVLGHKDCRNLGNSGLPSFPTTFSVSDTNMITFNAAGGTAYGWFSTSNDLNGVMHSDTDISLSSSYASNQHYVISTWFKTGTLSPTTKVPLFALGKYDVDGVLVAITSNKIYFGNGAIGGGMGEVPTALSNNTWYYVSLEYQANPGIFKIYLNGTELAQQNQNNYNWSNNHQLEIGGTQWGGGSGLVYADPALQIGNLIIDNSTAQYSDLITYNYNAYRSTGINGKYS